MTPAQAHDQYERTIEENDQVFASEDYDRVSDLVQEGNLIQFISFYFTLLSYFVILNYLYGYAQVIKLNFVGRTCVCSYCT